MTAFKKFLFDTDFDAPDPLGAPDPGEPEAEPEPPTYTEEDLTAARAEGVAVGRDEALRDAAGMLEKLTADALERLTGQLDELFAVQAQANAQAAADALTVGTTVMRKVFPELSRKGGLDEISGLLDEVMGRVLDEPRLTIRVNDALLEPVKERLAGAVAQRGYEGRLSIAADPQIPAGDCRVEWSDGGAERDTAVLWQEIDEIIERNLGPAPAAESEPTPAPESEPTDTGAPAETDPSAADPGTG